MTQKDRDRLVALKKAQKKQISQRQAAEERGVTERHVRRMVMRLKKGGDRSIVHGLRGRSSNRKLSPELREQAMRILAVGLSRLGRRWPAVPGKEKQAFHTAAKLRQQINTGRADGAAREKVEAVHQWRPRKARAGAMVRWNTSEHGWLERRAQALSDPHDRRRHQRVDGTVCEHDSTHEEEHCVALELSGTARTSAGVLHRQGRHVPHHAQGVPQIHRSFRDERQPAPPNR